MKKPSKKQTKELATLAQLPDNKIDLSDIPELPNWTNAVVGKFYRPIKRPVTVRIDADLLAWLAPAPATKPASTPSSAKPCTHPARQPAKSPAPNPRPSLHPVLSPPTQPHHPTVISSAAGRRFFSHVRFLRTYRPAQREISLTVFPLSWFFLSGISSFPTPLIRRCLQSLPRRPQIPTPSLCLVLRQAHFGQRLRQFRSRTHFFFLTLHLLCVLCVKKNILLQPLSSQFPAGPDPV